MGRENPFYRHKAILNKQKILKEYSLTDVFTESHQKIQKAEEYAKRIIKTHDEYSQLFDKEIEKFRRRRELERQTPKNCNDRLLTHDEATKALSELSKHSNLMGLPNSLVKYSNSAYLNILERGVPNETEVSHSVKCLKESLKNFVEVLDFERFNDITLEELKAKVSEQSWKNYFKSYWGYLDSAHVVPSELLPPTDENFPNYLVLIENYKRMEPTEKANLHEFETLENCVKEGNYMTIYKILRNNDKFLEYIVDGRDHLHKLEAYLLYHTLQEINHLQVSQRVV